MGTGILVFLAGVLKPYREVQKLKESESLDLNALAIIIIKTVGFWGALAMLLFAMSKGILSLDQVDQIIKDIKN